MVVSCPGTFIDCINFYSIIYYYKKDIISRVSTRYKKELTALKRSKKLKKKKKITSMN